MPYWLILYPSLMRYEVLPGRVCGRQVLWQELEYMSAEYRWHWYVSEENGVILMQTQTYLPRSKVTLKRMIRTLAEGQGYTRLPGSKELP